MAAHRFGRTFVITFPRSGGTVPARQRLLGRATLVVVKRYVAIAQTGIERALNEASPVSNWPL